MSAPRTAAACQPQRQSAVGRIISMKNSIDAIGNRNRDLPACRAVPRPTATPRTPVLPSSFCHCHISLIPNPFLTACGVPCVIRLQIPKAHNPSNHVKVTVMWRAPTTPSPGWYEISRFAQLMITIISWAKRDHKNSVHPTLYPPPPLRRRASRQHSITSKAGSASVVHSGLRLSAPPRPDNINRRYARKFWRPREYL